MLFPKENLNRKTLTTLVIASLAYLTIIHLLVGIKTENIIIVLMYNLLFLASEPTRKFITAFSIFIVFGIVYDLMKAFPNYMVNTVDIIGLHDMERCLFGISDGNVILTPNEFFALHHTWLLDLASGIFYINWMPIPLALGFYFFVKNKQQFLYFSLTFLLVNLIGFCVYYIHPAAPPWYLALHGSQVNIHVPGNPGGLIRFDEIVHLPVFQSIYIRNSNVFAAMPSLHSAYPVVVLFYGLKNKLGNINWFFGLFIVGIWFSAIYSGHHYLLDVIAGAACALVGIAIFQHVLLKSRWFKTFIKYYCDSIS